jgi:hypothetical protein
LLSFCPGWPWTSILLIFAFWVARIIGMSNQCPARYWFLILKKKKYFYLCCIHEALVFSPATRKKEGDRGYPTEDHHFWHWECLFFSKKA